MKGINGKNDIVDLTSQSESYYNSEYVEKYTWCKDFNNKYIEDNAGVEIKKVLYVKFKDSDTIYMYNNMERGEFYYLKRRSRDGIKLSNEKTAGQHIKNNIVPDYTVEEEFTQNGERYALYTKDSY